MLKYFYAMLVNPYILQTYNFTMYIEDYELKSRSYYLGN